MLRYPGLIFATLTLFACTAGPSGSERSEGPIRSGSESSDLVTLLISSPEEVVDNELANIGEELSSNPGVQTPVLGEPEAH